MVLRVHAGRRWNTVFTDKTIVVLQWTVVRTASLSLHAAIPVIMWITRDRKWSGCRHRSVERSG